MNSHGVEFSIAGGVEELVRYPNPRSFFFIFLLFFTFFFYHVFIVFRYKKLCAALAMERTKPINQKQTTKETKFPVHRAFTESTWAETICPSSPMGAKYKEFTTLELLLALTFFARKI